MSIIQRTAQVGRVDRAMAVHYSRQPCGHSVLDDIEERFQSLSENPLMGRLRPDIAPELRYFVVGKYLILYRTISNGIQIVRVIHGARDVPSLF